MAQEEAEAPIRKFKRLVRGKAKVMVPVSSKRKDFSKLDVVPRKRRKFLEASTVAAAKVHSFPFVLCCCSTFFLIL